MPSHSVSEVLQSVRRILLRQEGADRTDAQLLDLFLERRDEAALSELLWRHGPMVWGVCCRLLPNHHDAEDAFQATFLVLVRKARSIVPRAMVANWLYGVARHTALKARASAARRKLRERQVTAMSETASAEQELWDDLQPLLDQELSRLPGKYRAILVLCDLEGKSRKEAAQQLGLPEGTVASRLARARAMLAKRLARHGLTVSAAALAAVLAQKASASVPTSVFSASLHLTGLWAGGQGTAAGVVSIKVALLADGVLKAMLLTKLKVAVAILLAAGVMGVGVGLLGRRPTAGAASPVFETVRQEPAGINLREAAPAVLAAQDVGPLGGVWAVRQIETNGKGLFDRDALKDARITFEGNRAWVTGLPARFGHDFTFTLYPHCTPKAIDVTFLDGPGKGATFQGVYAVQGDEARLCVRLEHPEHRRPRGFATSSGTTLSTFRLQRPAELRLARLAPANVAAQPSRVIRKPVAEYAAAESDEPENAIAWAELAPDGQLVACYRRRRDRFNALSAVGKLTVYAVGEAKPLFTVEVNEAANAYRKVAAFSADGKWLAFWGKGKRIEIVSARTGKPHATAELPGGRRESVDALAFSPDGRKVAVASGVLYHKDLYVFDTANGKQLGQPLQNVDGSAAQLVFSADGKRLVANHYFTIYVVDADTYRVTARFGDPRQATSRPEAAGVFFLNDKLYAVGADAAVVEVAAAGIGKEPVSRLTEKKPDRVNLLRAAFAGRAGLVAIPMGNEVSVRTLRGRERFRVTGKAPVRMVALSADGRVLLVCRDSGDTVVFRLK